MSDGCKHLKFDY